MLTRSPRAQRPRPRPVLRPFVAGVVRRVAVLARRAWRGMAVWAETAGAVAVMLLLTGAAVAAQQRLGGAGGPSSGTLLLVAAVAGVVGMLTGRVSGVPRARRVGAAPLGWRGWGWRAAGLAWLVLLLVVVLAVGVAWADPAHLAQQAPPPPAPTPSSPDLDTVIRNLRNWLIGICAGAATLFFSLGGLRYMGANGDPGEIENAKRAFRNAAVGYGLAILAPLFLKALQSVVGA